MTTVSNRGPVSRFYPVSSSALQMYFTAGSRDGVGASIGWICSAGKCSSLNSSGAVYQAPTGRIISDTDGRGLDSRYTSEENCTWTARCPSGTYFNIASYLTSSPSLIDAVQIFDELNGHFLATLTQSSNRRLLLSSAVRIILSSPAALLSVHLPGMASRWTGSAPCLSAKLPMHRIHSRPSTPQRVLFCRRCGSSPLGSVVAESGAD